MKKNTKVAWIGMTIIIGMMAFVIGTHSSFKDDAEALVPVSRDKQVSLFVWMKTDKALLEPAPTEVKVGANLTFELSSSLPVHVSLLLTMNEKTPEVLLKNARIPPGQNKRLDRAGRPFVYPVLTAHTKLKFCLMYADTEKELRGNLALRDALWAKLPGKQCKLISVS